MTYGIHAVTTLLDNKPEHVDVLLLQKGRNDKKLAQLITLAKKNNTRIEYMDKKEFDRHYPEINHQGVIAKRTHSMTSLNENALWSLLDILKEPAFLLILDTITDPHNLGACLRSADAAGVHAVIAPKDKSVGLTAAAIKVASGAAETTPFIQVTNLARTLEALKEKGIWVYGAAGETETTLYEIDFKGPIAIVMGSEGKGLRRLTREHCDELFAIPMLGQVESLNVSVAGGVSMFEVVRQRTQA